MRRYLIKWSGYKKKYHYAHEMQKLEHAPKYSTNICYIIIFILGRKLKRGWKGDSVALEWISLVSTGNQSRGSIYGCLPTCAYIDIDSGIARFSRIRLIFITSFPLGNSKHILITFFNGALDLDASKASRCSVASTSLFRFSMMEYSVHPLTSSLNRAQPSLTLFSNASNSRESRSQSIQLCRSHVAGWIESARALPVVFIKRYSCRERNRDDYMHSRKSPLPSRHPHHPRVSPFTFLAL